MKFNLRHKSLYLTGDYLIDLETLAGEIIWQKGTGIDLVSSNYTSTETNYAYYCLLYAYMRREEHRGKRKTPTR